MDRAHRRWLGLGAVLVAALAIRVGVSTSQPTPADIVGAVERPSTAQARKPVEATQTAPQWSLDRSPISTPAFDPFASRAQPPPAPPPPVVAETPRPSAPPLPFKYMGRLNGDHVNAVFVTHENRVLTIEPGEQIEGNYRVESIGETEIVFTYVPLAERQVLPIR
jgi:hypothetical protein